MSVQRTRGQASIATDLSESSGENDLSGNGNGILLSGSAENRLEFNHASENTYGISLRGSTKMS